MGSFMGTLQYGGFSCCVVVSVAWAGSDPVCAGIAAYAKHDMFL